MLCDSIRYDTIEDKRKEDKSGQKNAKKSPNL